MRSTSVTASSRRPTRTSALNAGRITANGISSIWKAIAAISVETLEYDEALVRKLIERITVYDEKYVVEFKSGVEIDVRL